MAKNGTKTAQAPSAEWGLWQERIAKQSRLYRDFCNVGGDIVERYRLERRRATSYSSNSVNNFWRDKYNILYSSTETMRPALYAKTPKPQVDPRQRDTNNQTSIFASMLLENSLNYAIQEVNFDNVIKNAISDYLLPGLGMAWVRYEPEIVKGEGEGVEYVNFEGFGLDYIHFRDILTSEGRVWEDLWWIAKRVYYFPEEAKARFGEEKARKLNYTHQRMDKTITAERNATPGNADQAVIWEIWCKRTKEVIWFSEDCPELLDKQSDPLKLKGFYPCPEPLRAVTVTDTFIPTSFYSQYRQQAETLDTITSKIRILSKALRLVGVYDQSQAALSRLLTGDDNKMVGVENWAQFSGQGGLNGNVQFMPIQEVANVLSELYKQREIAKNEIYEITGFSDIVRGVSKASETLGAQEIKNQWAGGRLQMLQKEVQRFCRDILAIMAEIMAEQFSEDSLAIYSGFELPEVTPQEQQAVEQYTAIVLQGQQPPGPPPTTTRQAAVDQFKQVVQFLRNEKLRCARIDVETDSTLMPDEAAERKDRMDFLGAMGAFLQQAGPMAMQFPDMRGLLGALMMFTARTFNASRPIEKEFENFQKALQAAPPMDPNNNKEGGSGDDGQAKIAAEQQRSQVTLQVAQIKGQADEAKVQANNNVAMAEIEAKYAFERDKLDREYALKERELALREREVAVKEAELGIKQEDMEHKHEMAEEDASREDERLENERENLAVQSLASENQD